MMLWGVLGVVASLVGCLVAGPVTWDDSKCSQECNAGSKYQYLEQTAYLYSYEASNELQAKRTSDLITQLKATVKITTITKCEMLLELSNVETESSSFSEKLQKHPLPFSFNDGYISHVCPNPEDSDEVTNIKKAILSSFQNTMKSFDFATFNSDVDILGSCDTTYKSKEKDPETFEIFKTKHVPSCSNHLHSQSILLSSLYESGANRQHLPIQSNEKAECKQTISKGIVEEVKCEESALFKLLGKYGYVVTATGRSKLKKLSSEPASKVIYKAPKKESLVFKFTREMKINPNAESEARDIMKDVCQQDLSTGSAFDMHKLVYTVRQMDSQSVENVYSALKNKEFCEGKKPMTVYLDALRMASSGGSIALLSKLVINKELSELDSLLWLTFLPFTSYVEEKSISAALPMLEKGIANRQILLGITALAYKYCSIDPECESTQAIKDLSSSLKAFLGDKCNANTKSEEIEILTALKALGNLGYFDTNTISSLFECATTATNNKALRIAAIDSFRRSPCKEEIISQLLDIYSTKTENDELRIAALMSINVAKCGTNVIMKKIMDSYSTESSKQVGVFTWSYLENLRKSSSPVKARIRKLLEYAEIKRPSSTDITKFSRNFELSYFSEIFNLGILNEANIVHSADSFLPRSGNLAHKLHLFGNHLETIEVGARVEDLEHILEKIFGPAGILQSTKVEDILKLLPKNFKRTKRSAEKEYEAKIDALSERLGYKRNTVPHGTAFVRIMGNELGLIHLNEESIKSFASSFIQKASNVLKNGANFKGIDTRRNLAFIDVSIRFPSLTGRAYKLAGNGTLAVGLKADGKIDLSQPDFPVPRVDIDGKFKPSIQAKVDAMLTIDGDDFQPGVQSETVLNAGLDYKVKLEIKDGRLIHVKLTRDSKRSAILNIKRVLYNINKNGKVEMEKTPSHNLEYCTKYIQKLVGAKFCASLTIPHAFENGNFRIPFVREFEVNAFIEQTDPTMDGIEFFLELPIYPQKGDKKIEERRFKVFFLRNSREDEKVSLDVTLKKPDQSTCSLGISLLTPFYTLDVNGLIENTDDRFRLTTDVNGDGKRQYSLNIDTLKVVKGARLVEYQPKIKVSLPSRRPKEFTGTIVYAKGRKAQISVNLESKSYATPFTIKGNMVREGESIDLSSNWKLTGEFNVTMNGYNARVHNAIGYDSKGLNADVGYYVEPDGRSYESIQFIANIKDVKIFDRLSFNVDSRVLFAQREDLNSMLTLDFSFKPLNHFKSDLIFRYGENFEDDKHVVQATIVSALHGDFNSFQKLNIQNKVALTISCFDFDKSAALSVMYDFIDKPHFCLEVGIKRAKDKEIKIDFNYRHTQQEPLILATDFTFTLNTYKFQYTDSVTEIAPREYKYHSIIEPAKGKEITSDFIYHVKSEADFHHELEGTIRFPGLSEPVKEKGLLKFSKEYLKFDSETDFGRGNKYIVGLELQEEGINELKLNTPFVEGNLVVDGRSSTRNVQADFKAKGRYNRRIKVNGKVTPGETNKLSVDVEWDAERDPEKKVNIELTSSIETEEGIEKYIIGGSIQIYDTHKIEISSTISTDLIKGPHFFRAEYSGSTEPMACEIEHEIKDGHLTTVTKYLRSGVEKIRQDIKGKLIHRGFSHFEIEGGVLTSSPYKTFDGKSLFFRLMFDSEENKRTFLTEYHLKFSPAIGYEGKINYVRNRGWPGKVRSLLHVTVHNKPIYEGITDVDYGNGKYSWKTSFTPHRTPAHKYHFIASFEHSARFAAFYHSLATSLKYLQTVDLNAVADLRNMEDATLHSNIDINSNKIYDVKSTLKLRSMIDFETEATLFSKISPSIRIFSKAQTSGTVTKYDLNLNIDSKDIITATGELKKRKKGLNGDISFKLKDKEIVVLTVGKQDGKNKERNYSLKLKFPETPRFYTANIKISTDKKAINYDTKFCKNEKKEEHCIDIDATHKEYDHVNEWQVTYKRGDVEFSVERIRESSEEVERFHTVIYKGDQRFGYDVRFGKLTAESGRSISLGLIIPSREIVIKTSAEFSISKPRVKIEFASDAKNHPARKLVTDIKFENHLRDNNPSKLDISISHPIFEKTINFKLSGDYEPTSAKYFTAGASLDYSNNPDDKLISKLSVEKLSGGTGVVLLKTYHRDEDHLDFVIKINGTRNSNENSFAILYTWKDENGADTEAYIIGSCPQNERRFYFAYQRPNFSYRLDGQIDTTAENLLNDTKVIKLESVFNGETTKGTLVTNQLDGCYKLTLEKDEPSRIEICVNSETRKMVSILIESVDEEEWNLDYLLEIYSSNYNTLGFRQQMNPDFLGTKIFQITSLFDDLDEARMLVLPFYNSERFKIYRASLSSKLLEPAMQFVIPEAEKFAKDIVTDANTLRRAIVDYSRKLPSLEAVKERFEEARKIIRSIAYQIFSEIFSYYETYFHERFSFLFDYINKIQDFASEKCRNNKDCQSLVSSYENDGWKGLLQELRNLLLALPDKIQEFLENPGEDVKKYFNSASRIIKAFLHSLTKYRCGEIVTKIVALSYEALEPKVQYLLNQAPEYYKNLKARLARSEYFKLSIELLKKGYLKVREEVLSIDYKKLAALARKHFEDYLLTLRPPNAKEFVTVNAISTEKGIVDIEIYCNVAYKIGERLKNLVWVVASRSVKAGFDFYNYNTLLIKLKRILDLQFIPPYDEQGMIVGHKHFMTFDKVFYDFAGECSYLLARDFEDGNFTLALKPKGDGDDPTLILFRGQTNVEFTSGKTSVHVKGAKVQLPYFSDDLSVKREGDTIALETRQGGLKLKCNTVHKICTFLISGFYYGKTAGLLGTYNYEDYDEFKRPKGHIANSVTVFAKSYELKRGCKTSNLVSEVEIDKNSEYYKQCKSHFESNTSPLAACFPIVPPDNFLSLCLRHLASESNQKTALCDIAAAYVTECEKNYVGLKLPPKCLVCDAPDGSKLEYGNRKKFEQLQLSKKKTAETVFLLEDHECNKGFDLGNLARSIEREMENEGFTQNTFGLIGFGGEIGHPQIFTAKDKLLFSSRDINTITERFKFESKKGDAAKAFQSIKHAVTHLFRSHSAKSLVLILCSACKYDFTSLNYPVVQQILLEQGISLHVIKDTEIPIRKSSAKDNIIGMDPDTVFHTKDVTEKELVGEPNLRSQVVMPKDLCIALSQDVNGSFFSTHPISKASSNEVKNWRSVFTRRFLKSIQLFGCQWCDCISTKDHLPKTVCQPCEMRRPRLPFSVGSSNAYTRTLEAFLSYLLHVIRDY